MHSTATDEVLAVGGDGAQEALWLTEEVAVQKHLALPVEDADVHGSRVQVDPAVVLVGLGVESHGSLLKRMGWCRTIQPTPCGP